jgi:hypothetical protein
MWGPEHRPKSPRMKFAHRRSAGSSQFAMESAASPATVSETFAETDQGYAAFKGSCGHFAGEAFSFRYFFLSQGL